MKQLYVYTPSKTPTTSRFFVVGWRVIRAMRVCIINSRMSPITDRMYYNIVHSHYTVHTGGNTALTHV